MSIDSDRQVHVSEFVPLRLFHSMGRKDSGAGLSFFLKPKLRAIWYTEEKHHHVLMWWKGEISFK